MKTLYVDHHVIAREIGGQPANWLQLAELLAANSAWRLAVSECNLLEIASDGDKPRARCRAAFVDSLNPLWMMERFDIQKCEVAAFLWKHHFNAAPPPYTVFNEHLSTVMGFHTRPLIGVTAVSWVAQADPTEVADAKRLTVQSLRTLQGATKQQKQRTEKAKFRAWVDPKIPPRDPGGSWFKRTEREALAAFCDANRDEFFCECPAMGVEHYLCEARTRDPNRQPTESDAIDLQHTVLGLSYCDALVTERYAFSTAEHAIKSLAPLALATIHRKLTADVFTTVRHTAAGI
jgi:hypothetical protein